MNKYLDIEFKRNTDGIFDISIENGDIVMINSFSTAIDISIYAERRAEASEQPVNYLQRGWWGNELSDVQGFEIGSKLWELTQARDTTDTRNKAIAYLQEAFQWLIDDGHLTDVTIDAADLSHITVRFMRGQNTVDSRSFSLWDNTKSI